MVQAGNVPADVEAAIYEQLERLTEDSITDRDLQKAINQAQSSFTFRQDSIQQQGFTIGFFHMLQSYTMV